MLETRGTGACCEQVYRGGEGGSACWNVAIGSRERGRCSLADENKCCGG